MHLRMNASKANPTAYQAMQKLDGTAKELIADNVIYELIKIRASQINGCAFCVDMHTTDSRAMGESECRLNLIVVWRESPQFTEKERAALALTEAVTLISEDGVPQSVYDEARKHFDESEFVALLLAINAINGWNRIAIATGMFPDCFAK
ncbi:carboxymuconolactone decarboxylase family protein [Paenibacillus sp. BC26]|uniref:carboxymuconolactone decarboxylase family protein n=1 Tax=Paenibacillus sp. BC26 TaxID=1881032 RepID=UPI0008E2A908|nr:carboxymuconolactone decarboxylase family protein [Paenibacillus sp. BC26]SFT26907.1 alkylhydroperoxidase AhpD family core domain-containing protein [Paenibacillus sp. BC26]